MSEALLGGGGGGGGGGPCFLFSPSVLLQIKACFCPPGLVSLSSLKDPMKYILFILLYFFPQFFFFVKLNFTN